MSSLILCAMLACAPPLQGDDPTNPKRVEAAVSAIETALASSKAAEAAAGLAKHAGLADARVVAALARGLKDARPDVRVAAMDALGRTPHADALAALTGYYAAEKKALRGDKRALPRLLIAIARHGNPTAIAVLTDDVQAQLDSKTVAARILGLANIRAKESITALLALADKIGFLEQNTHADNLRLALCVLTGEDRGRSLEAWNSWWKESQKTFAVARELPALSKTDRERWQAFWSATK